MSNVLVLRVCKEDLTSYNNFQYPESGFVKAPDWSSKPRCGSGLHGLLWGKQSSKYIYDQYPWGEKLKGLVLEVKEQDVVVINDSHGDKVKFSEGEVVFCGTVDGACEYIYKRCPDGWPSWIDNIKKAKIPHMTGLKFIWKGMDLNDPISGASGPRWGSTHTLPCSSKGRYIMDPLWAKGWIIDLKDRTTFFLCWGVAFERMKISTDLLERFLDNKDVDLCCEELASILANSIKE